MIPETHAEALTLENPGIHYSEDGITVHKAYSPSDVVLALRGYAAAQIMDSTVAVTNIGILVTHQLAIHSMERLLGAHPSTTVEGLEAVRNWHAWAPEVHEQFPATIRGIRYASGILMRTDYPHELITRAWNANIPENRLARLLLEEYNRADFGATTTFIHGNAHPENVIGGRWLDLDHVRIGSPEYDIGRMLVRSAQTINAVEEALDHHGRNKACYWNMLHHAVALAPHSSTEEQRKTYLTFAKHAASALGRKTLMEVLLD